MNFGCVLLLAFTISACGGKSPAPADAAPQDSAALDAAIPDAPPGDAHFGNLGDRCGTTPAALDAGSLPCGPGFVCCGCCSPGAPLHEDVCDTPCISTPELPCDTEFPDCLYPPTGD